MDQQNAKLEADSKAIFARVRAQEPSPFMKRRILANLDKEPRKGFSEVWFWRFVSGVSLTVAAMAMIFNMRQVQQQDDAGLVAMKPYVIHVDLSGQPLEQARIAQIELPEGVHFVSKKHPEVSKMRSMRMPVPAASSGRSRLPFVVSSDRPGTQEVVLKILDENDQVIQTRTLTVSFAAEKNT